MLCVQLFQALHKRVMRVYAYASLPHGNVRISLRFDLCEVERSS